MRLRFIAFFLSVGGFLLTIPSAQANDLDNCLAEKKQAWSNKKSWHVMAGGCPIGDGLWDRAPKSAQSRFWVQCGVTSALPLPWFANLLENIVPNSQIILRDEGGRYRCLLGPYDQYDTALKVKNEMVKDKSLRNAFVREIQGQSSGASQRSTTVASTPTSKSNPPIKPTPVTQSKIEPPKSIAQQLTGQSDRKFIEIDGLFSPEPYVDELHHIEEQKAWLRASLPEANAICKKDGMHLVSIDKLRQIANSKDQRMNFPKRLPFWVSEQKAYDMAMMVPIKLTENSALYVMCEK